ncbi:hypothetical protein CDD83_3392 [Cordyceps sp. RAO-2017]|nr:hypothetical protein CDD83_3392 [Cordyceps sp. RAO-2017]
MPPVFDQPAAGAPGSGRKTITSTLTRTYTIASCAPTVTNCPLGKTTTEIITTSTVIRDDTGAVPRVTQAPVARLGEVVTATITRTFTITACASTVTNCPLGKVTTEVITTRTTVGSGPAAVPAVSQVSVEPLSTDRVATVTMTRTFTITGCAPTISSCPLGKVTTEVITTLTTVGAAVPTMSRASDQPLSSSKADRVATVTMTRTLTITGCALTVKNCPLGKVMTEVITTLTTIGDGAVATPTISPTSVEPLPPHNSQNADRVATITITRTLTIESCPPGVEKCPLGKVTTEVVTTQTTIRDGPVAVPTTSQASIEPLPSHNPDRAAAVTITRVYTVENCAPSVEDCPRGKVTTSVVTVMPTRAHELPEPTTAPGSGRETMTTTVTRTHTVTSCAPTVTDCPLGKVTTEVVTMTYCPGDGTRAPDPPTADPGSVSGHVPPAPVADRLPFRPGHAAFVNGSQSAPPAGNPDPNHHHQDASGTARRPSTMTAKLSAAPSVGTTGLPTADKPQPSAACLGSGCARPPPVASGAARTPSMAVWLFLLSPAAVFLLL